MAEYEQAVFISYAWGAEREDIVNEIDETLQQRGIRIVRDKRALGYKGSIKEFMERIGQGSCVIVVISDKYLRSPNCMFELVEIAENKQFHDRVFPIVLSDANIYDPIKRIEYVKHWEAKRKELAKAMKTLDPANLQGIRDDMDQYDRIRDQISGITSTLKDMNTLTPDIHRDSEFSNLYDAIVKRLEEGATNVTTEFIDLAKKAEEERQAREATDRLAAQMAEVERLAQEKAETEQLAKAKAEAELLIKEEADRLAAQKAEAERKAQEKAENERVAQLKAQEELKAKEEANRLAAQKAEAERIGQEKAQVEQLAAQNIEAERLAQAKAEFERKAKEDADRLAAQKAKEMTPAEAMPAGIKTATVPNQATKKKPVRLGLIIGGVAAMVVCLVAAVIVFGVLSSGSTPASDSPVIPDTGNSSSETSAPTDVPTDIPTEAPSAVSTEAPAAPASSNSGQCSIESKEAISVNFVNDSGVKLDTYWVDFNCGTKYYFSLDPGQSVSQDTFVSHVWRFVDPQSNNLHLEYVAKSGDTSVSVP